MKVQRLCVPMFAVVAVAALLAATLPRAAMADTLDPNVFICQGCTAPPSAPTLLTNVNSIAVGVAGSFTLQNPLLIIVGVYDGNGTPNISYSGCTTPSACPLATVGTYGLTANTTTFTTGTAYAQLGLSAGGSESFGNWACGGSGCPGTGGDIGLGLAMPTGFTLYAFALNTSLSSGSPITIDESGAAIGSYIIAYDCKAVTGSSSGCATNGDIGQTPYTTSGIVDHAPEPTSVALLGLVVLGFGAIGVFGRRKLLA